MYNIFWMITSSWAEGERQGEWTRKRTWDAQQEQEAEGETVGRARKRAGRRPEHGRHATCKSKNTTGCMRDNVSDIRFRKTEFIWRYSQLFLYRFWCLVVHFPEKLIKQKSSFFNWFPRKEEIHLVFRRNGQSWARSSSTSTQSNTTADTSASISLRAGASR